MQAPSRADYVGIYFTLFEQFEQTQAEKSRMGRPFVYTEKTLIVFFSTMMIRRIVEFKAQRRWLEAHPEQVNKPDFQGIPHRTTLSWRFKRVYEPVQDFVAFVGRWVENLCPDFSSQALLEDGSLFKAHSPVWHQSGRRENRIPERLRTRRSTQTGSGQNG